MGGVSYSFRQAWALLGAVEPRLRSRQRPGGMTKKGEEATGHCGQTLEWRETAREVEAGVIPGVEWTSGTPHGWLRGL